MNEQERELDMALADAEQENRKLRAEIQLLTEALRAQAMPPPPMECKTDAEKIAYAFGWHKCMELNNRIKEST